MRFGLEKKDRLLYERFSKLLSDDPKQAYEFFMENPDVVHCCYVGELPAIYHQLKKVGENAANSFRAHVDKVLEDCLIISNFSDFLKTMVDLEGDNKTD